MTDQFEPDALFSLYVIQQQQLAWLYLGKMANPVTGKTERNLDAAKFIIDTLGVIETKTTGNLSKEEEQLMGQVLTTLRLNFLEESRKPDSGQGKDDAGQAPGDGGKTDSGQDAQPDEEADSGEDQERSE